MRRRLAAAASAFLGAGGLYAVALAGESGSWLIALVGTLFLLTLGFFCLTRPLPPSP